MKTESDPIVEILRLAYRRGLALRRQQSKNEASPIDNKVRSDDMEFAGDNMDKQKALETVDAAIKALTELEHALKRDDGRLVNMEIQILWLELGNLREMVENMKDKDG